MCVTKQHSALQKVTSSADFVNNNNDCDNNSDSDVDSNDNNSITRNKKLITIIELTQMQNRNTPFILSLGKHMRE